MWLSDILQATRIMADFFGEFTCGFTKVSGNIYGDMIFSTDAADGRYYVVSPKTGRIIKRYPDTWKNPEHQEILQKGEEEE